MISDLDENSLKVLLDTQITEYFWNKYKRRHNYKAKYRIVQSKYG